jgi:hypothetical protein
MKWTPEMLLKYLKTSSLLYDLKPPLSDIGILITIQEPPRYPPILRRNMRKHQPRPRVPRNGPFIPIHRNKIVPLPNLNPF